MFLLISIYIYIKSTIKLNLLKRMLAQFSLGNCFKWLPDITNLPDVNNLLIACLDRCKAPSGEEQVCHHARHWGHSDAIQHMNMGFGYGYKSR